MKILSYDSLIEYCKILRNENKQTKRKVKHLEARIKELEIEIENELIANENYKIDIDKLEETLRDEVKISNKYYAMLKRLV